MPSRTAVQSSRQRSRSATPSINQGYRVSRPINGQQRSLAVSGRSAMQTHIQYCNYCKDVHKKSAFSGPDAVSCKNALDRGVPFGNTLIVHEVFQAVVQPNNDDFMFEYMHSNTGGWDCLPQDITVYAGRVVISNTYAVAKVSKFSRGPSKWCAKLSLIHLAVKFCDHVHGNSPEVQDSYHANDMDKVTRDIKRVNCKHLGCNAFFYFQRHACKEEPGMDVIVLKVERELSHNYELSTKLASPSSTTWTSASVSRETFSNCKEKVKYILASNARIIGRNRTGM